MSLTPALKGVIFAVSSGRKHDHEQMGGALGGTHDVTTDQRTNHDGRDAMRRPRLS
jgi:hypothetical protein